MLWLQTDRDRSRPIAEERERIMFDRWIKRKSGLTGIFALSMLAVCFGGFPADAASARHDNIDQECHVLALELDRDCTRTTRTRVEPWPRQDDKIDVFCVSCHGRSARAQADIPPPDAIVPGPGVAPIPWHGREF